MAWIKLQFRGLYDSLLQHERSHCGVERTSPILLGLETSGVAIAPDLLELY